MYPEFKIMVMLVCTVQKIIIETRAILFSTTQEQLDYLRFPLGEIDKTETRNMARKLNLNVAEKPDSQDVFVPNGDYSSVIKKFRPESFKKGKILDIFGNEIGEHDGIINYTIGQRKGMFQTKNPFM